MDYTLKLEEPSKVTRKLTITIPAEIVTQRFNQQINAAQKQAKLKGFRPGMVPLAMVKKMYGSEIRHRLYHAITDEFYARAMEEKKLRPVSRPKIESTGGHSVEEGKDLNYTATVEIFPEIEIKSYTGFSLKKEQFKVLDKDVDQVVNNFRDVTAELKPVQGRAAKKGDFVDIAFKGSVETDNGFEERENMSGERSIEIGSKSLIPGFEDELVGMEAGGNKTFELKFPDDYGAAELKGKKAKFAVDVREIKEKILPEFTDELAKQYGYQSVDDFKKKARENITRDREREVESKLRNDLLEQLIKKNPFDVPNALLLTQSQRLAQEFAQNLKQQGLTDEMIQDALKREEKNIRSRAENQIRAGLILDTISKKEKIEVKKERLDQEVEKLAQRMNMEVSKLKEYYQKNPEKLEDLQFQVREDLTLELILSQSKVL